MWLLALVAVPRIAAAQDPTISLPPTLILPNYDRVQIGQREGLEAGAFVARTDDASASWYNPAGLVLSPKSGVNASAVAYEWTTLTVEGSGSSTSRSRFGSISTLVAGVIGAPIIDSDRWRLGVSVTTPVAWQPGTINALFTRTTASGEDRFNYLSEVSFTTLLPAVSAGFRVRPGLRLGAGAWFSWTSLTQNQSAVARSASVDSAVTVFRRFDSDGSVLAASLALGAQLDFARAWVAGLTLTTPSGRIWGESQVSFDGEVTRPSLNGDIFFRDEKARFDYKQPLRIAFGVARRFERGAVELDLRFHGSTDRYAMYSSDELGRRNIVRPLGAPPVYENVRYEDTVYEARQVWNSAIGGHYDLNKRWTVHAGFFTDISPVANAQETILRKVDLFGGTGGLSLHGEHLSGSFGAGWSVGDSGDAVVGTLADGTPIQTNVKVRTINLAYAVSYAF